MAFDFTATDYFIWVIAYIIGSIPFGLILSKIAGGGDIRKQGSGNIGATNVARIVGKKLGAVVLALDVFKGVLAVVFALYYGSPNTQVYVAGACVVLGHVFPVWIKFRGGKGVSTSFGVLMSLNLFLGLGLAAIWVFTFIRTRYSSIASLTTALSAPILALLLSANDYALMYLALVLAVIVIIRHHSNIRRLLQGEEGKM